MNILEIYNKYAILENLQMHMLRVSACASYILDHWNGPKLNKESIIRVCLLHDMGNIAKIPEDEVNDEKFRKIRKEYIQKYGEYDHPINVAIARQEGLNEKEIAILNAKRSRYNEKTLNENNYDIKICAYCDQRVAPEGVVGIKERLKDAKRRYKNRDFSVWSNEEKANHLIDCAIGIESQIFIYCDKKPEEINDKNMKEYIDKLKQYEIERR